MSMVLTLTLNLPLVIPREKSYIWTEYYKKFYDRNFSNFWNKLECLLLAGLSGID